MHHTDNIHRFIFDKTDIRGEIISLEQAFQNATVHQSIPSTLKPLLGEFIAAALLLGEILKFEGLLTLQARGDGAVPLIMAEVDHQGHFRGILRVQDDADVDTHLPLPTIVGHGNLSITIDPSKGERYQGIIPLEQANLSACLAQYFQQSEQLPSYIVLFADEDKCGGLFLQSLPVQEVADPATREELWSTAKHLAATADKQEFFSHDHATILYRLFHEMSCRVFQQKPVRFRCNCSRARAENSLISLGREDAFALLREQDIIQIDCQFCGKKYVFGEQDLEEMFSGGVQH